MADSDPLATPTGSGRILQRLPRRGVGLKPSYLVSRLVAAIFAVFAAFTIVFFFMMSTGNPAVLLVGPEGGHDQIEALNALYGFDRPIYEQYWKFIVSSVTGNFPASLRFGTSPFAVVGAALPLTLLLGGVSIVLGALLGLSVGYVSVMARHWFLRELPLAAMTVVQATPVFVVGILLVLLFAVQLRWLPTGGADSWRNLVLPAITLSLMVAPPVARLFRASLIQQLEADHVRTALAKDIPMSQVRSRHIALNALVPAIALLGLQSGSLLGGAVLTEAVFGWPGLGTTLLGAISVQDYPVIIVAIVLIAAMVSICNFVADIATAILDPRTVVA